MNEEYNIALITWIKGHRYLDNEGEQFTLYCKMYSFLFKHPDLLETRSFPEIETLATR